MSGLANGLPFFITHNRLRGVDLDLSEALGVNESVQEIDLEHGANLQEGVFKYQSAQERKQHGRV